MNETDDGLEPGTGSPPATTATVVAASDPVAPRGAADLADLDEVSDDELLAAREARAARAGSRRPKSRNRNIVEWVVVVGGAILVAVLVRMFVFQTFWIPSPSMSSTLVKNDRVLVNKLSYKAHDVHRGDVVVFERPSNDPALVEKDLIKRVVGLQGERVSIMGGTVRIGGRPLREPYTDGAATEAQVVGCTLENTPGIDTAGGFRIPDGHVLVMGDNRTDSHDGRCFGPIDEDLIVGRAFLILWPPSKIGGL